MAVMKNKDLYDKAYKYISPKIINEPNSRVGVIEAKYENGSMSFYIYGFKYFTDRQKKIRKLNFKGNLAGQLLYHEKDTGEHELSPYVYMQMYYGGGYWFSFEISKQATLHKDKVNRHAIYTQFCLDYEELVNEFKKVLALKYISISVDLICNGLKYENKFNIADLYRYLVKNARYIEMCHKFNRQDLIYNKSVLKCGKKRITNILKLLNATKHKGYLGKYVPSKEEIDYATLHHLDIYEAVKNRLRGELVAKLPQIKGYDKQVINYLMDRSILEATLSEINIYIDYITTLTYLGANTNSVKVLMPKKLLTAHDKTIKELQNHKSEIIDRTLSEIANRYKFKLSGYECVVLDSQKEFVKLGNTLHMCVGRLNYDEKMSKLENFIIAIKKEDKYYACCEIKYDKKEFVNQLYLDHDSLPPQDFRKQVDSELLPQFKKYPFKGKNYERNQLLKVRAFD